MSAAEVRRLDKLAMRRLDRLTKNLAVARSQWEQAVRDAAALRSSHEVARAAGVSASTVQRIAAKRG